MKITGNGMTTTVVDAHHASRVVSIGATGNVPDVTVENMTLENGQAAKTAGIHVEDKTLGTLNLNGVQLTGNIVNGGHVDANSVFAATLNITGSLITGNQSTASTAGGDDGINGGEIEANGTSHTITNTSVTNNQVVSALNKSNLGLLDIQGAITAVGSHFDGNTLTTPGAGTMTGVFDSGNTVIKDSSIDNNIISVGAGGRSVPVIDTVDLDLERSSISGNAITVGDTATGFAIIWPSPRNTDIVADSTISGNSFTIGRSSALHGVTYHAEQGASLTFTNNTVAKNTVSLGPGASVTGGTFDIGSGTAALSNVIISGNTPSNCITPLPGGSTSHSLDSDSSCGIGTGSGNLSGVDPRLGPLQVNAPGATQTMAIDQTSPAYNTADNATCPTIDQRGVTRLFAGDNLCDMGAFEFVPPIPALPKAGASLDGGQPWPLPGALALLLGGLAVLCAGNMLNKRRTHRRS